MGEDVKRFLCAIAILPLSACGGGSAAPPIGPAPIATSSPTPSPSPTATATPTPTPSNFEWTTIVGHEYTFSGSSSPPFEVSDTGTDGAEVGIGGEWCADEATAAAARLNTTLTVTWTFDKAPFTITGTGNGSPGGDWEGFFTPTDGSKVVRCYINVTAIVGDSPTGCDPGDQPTVGTGNFGWEYYTP